jgi:prepilin-type N-terminal cleavage/methylation domain-containing protein
MNRRGVTLVELMVVMSIIAILAIALGFTYQGWMGRYKVERQTKDIYTDLMDARGRAQTRGTAYFFDVNTPAPPAGRGRYRVIEDTNGNLNSEPGAGDTVPVTFPKTVEYVITMNGGGGITFDRRGTASASRTICVTTTADPDYDCIMVSATRINMGKLTTQISAGGACDAANCIAR